jgi:hypothetical protein
MPYTFLGYSPAFGGGGFVGWVWYKGQVQMANWGSWIFRSMDPSDAIVAIELGIPDTTWYFFDPAVMGGGGGGGRGGAGYDPPGLSVTIEILKTLPGSTEAQVVQEIRVTDKLPAGVW